MKILTVLLIVFFAIVACQNKVISEGNLIVEKNSVSNYLLFGAEVSSNNVLSKEALLSKYKNLKVGDTLLLTYSSKINEVCSKKGCWMKNDLGKGNEIMVRFKDYGFFIPLDSKGRNVIVEGKAYVTEIPVEDLKHYAEDAGKNKAEIEAITAPKYTYSFMSNGVLIEN
jgi:hypothetical protein